MLSNLLHISGTRSANNTHTEKKKKSGGGLNIICMRQFMRIAGIMRESHSHPRLWEDSRPQRPYCTLPTVTRRSGTASIQGRLAGSAHSGVIIFKSRQPEN